MRQTLLNKLCSVHLAGWDAGHVDGSVTTAYPEVRLVCVRNSAGGRRSCAHRVSTFRQPKAHGAPLHKPLLVDALVFSKCHRGGYLSARIAASAMHHDACHAAGLTAALIPCAGTGLTSKAVALSELATSFSESADGPTPQWYATALATNQEQDRAERVQVVTDLWSAVETLEQKVARFQQNTEARLAIAAYAQASTDAAHKSHKEWAEKHFSELRSLAIAHTSCLKTLFGRADDLDQKLTAVQAAQPSESMVSHADIQALRAEVSALKETLQQVTKTQHESQAQHEAQAQQVTQVQRGQQPTPHFYQPNCMFQGWLGQPAMSADWYRQQAQAWPQQQPMMHGWLGQQQSQPGCGQQHAQPWPGQQMNAWHGHQQAQPWPAHQMNSWQRQQKPQFVSDQQSATNNWHAYCQQQAQILPGQQQPLTTLFPAGPHKALPANAGQMVASKGSVRQQHRKARSNRRIHTFLCKKRKESLAGEAASMLMMHCRTCAATITLLLAASMLLTNRVASVNEALE